MKLRPIHIHLVAWLLWIPLQAAIVVFALTIADRESGVGDILANLAETPVLAGALAAFVVVMGYLSSWMFFKFSGFLGKG